MATVTSFTAEKMQEIVDAAIVDAEVISNNLILTREDGATIDAGSVLASAPLVITSAAELAAITPVDGQEIIFVADAANGIIWRFRYRAAAAGTYKWEYIGGSELMNYVAGVTPGTQSTSYVAQTGGPAVTIPLAGDYDVNISAQLSTNVTGVSYMSFGTSAGSASDVNAIAIRDSSFTWQGPLSRKVRSTGLAAAAVLTNYYHSSGAGISAYAQYRKIAITPVRVG